MGEPAELTEPSSETTGRLADERWELLRQIDAWLDTPMVVLAFVWLVLIVVEFVYGGSPVLDRTSDVIWVLFIIDFLIGFLLAPAKLPYLTGNWLKAISLALPALRMFRVIGVLRATRIARAAGATRGLRLVRVLSGLNRGMRAFGASMSRRGFGYVSGLTLLVTFVGAAGMYAFEKDARGSIDSYGEALWWTAMLMTTLGSERWPQTGEGRVLCFCLALYAFAVFGYVTATLATFFIGRDAENAEAEVAGTAALTSLTAEVAALREEIRQFRQGTGE